ncbi:MAG: ABC transporter ATP-binding protein [Verrucomicrobiia bacterium]
MRLLEAKGITQRFGGLCALEGFCLRVEEGELVGIIGPNGAGKTTVFNVLTGFYRPTEGRVELLGRDVTGEAPHRIARAGLARTFQNIRIFKNLTVLDNVRNAFSHRLGYAPWEAVVAWPGFRRAEEWCRREAEVLLERFDLGECRGELPGDLPYGVQRRVELARALALRPKVLLLDEPAAGMNPSEVGKLMERIGWIRDEFGVAIVVIEHQMQLVMGLCERLVVLDFGKTIAEGLPREIRAHPRVLEAYLGTSGEQR